MIVQKNYFINKQNKQYKKIGFITILFYKIHIKNHLENCMKRKKT